MAKNLLAWSAVLVVLLAGCSAENRQPVPATTAMAPPTEQEATAMATQGPSSPTAQNAAPLGQWIASCRDINTDSSKLKDDLAQHSPQLLHDSNLRADPAKRSRALAAIAPLNACSNDRMYNTGLADSLPELWETAAAEGFATLISESWPTEIASSQSRDNSDCPSCSIISSVEFDHPRWGRVRLETYTETPLPTRNPSKSGYRVVSTKEHSVLLNKRLDDQFFSLNVYPEERNGFLLIQYNPGRYDGVIVLHATADGMEDFGTDSYPRSYSGRFYDADVVRDASGFKIVHSVNDCTPSCAQGRVTKTSYVYDSSVNDLVASAVP